MTPLGVPVAKIVIDASGERCLNLEREVVALPTRKWGVVLPR
jgi:hypothetical protein